MTAHAGFASFAAWLLTFALHSTCALGVALVLGVVLRDRLPAWQERLLCFVWWAPLVSSGVQFLLLGGPCTGGFGPAAAGAPVAGATESLLSAAPIDAAPLAVARQQPDLATGPMVVTALAAADAAAGLCWLWVSRRRLARVLAGRRPEPEQRVCAEAAAAASRLGFARLPRVTRCDQLSTPIAFGLLRPEVCLPRRTGELGAASLRALLTHELAHLRRRDPLVMSIGALLQALFPWQLLLPLARRRWLRLVERRCDAIAAGQTSPTAVARCLLEVAEWLRPTNGAALPALGMAARPSSLRDRVEAALQPQAAAPPRRLLSFAFGSVSLSALAIAGPGLQPVPDAAPAAAGVADVAGVAVSAEATASPTPIERMRGEHAALAAEAARLQAEFAGRPVSPELEQLLVALQRRLLVVERLAARIEQRAASRSIEAR